MLHIFLDGIRTCLIVISLTKIKKKICISFQAMSYSFDGGGDYVQHQPQFTSDSSNSCYYQDANQTVQVKQEPDFHMFGSNGLLDMLATVATQTLNNDVSLRDVKTRPMSPQFEVKPNVSGNGTAFSSGKASSSRNPRSLTDYDLFTFQQVNT